MVKVNILQPIMMFIRGNIKMVKNMGMGNVCIRIKISMKDSGKMIDFMEKGSICIIIKIKKKINKIKCMKVSGGMDKNMAKDYMSMRME